MSDEPSTRIITLGEYMYAVNGAYLSKINLSDGTIVNNNYAILSNETEYTEEYSSISTDGTNLYMGQIIYTDAPLYNILKINTITGNVILNWAVVPGQVNATCIIGQYMYVAVGSEQKIMRVSLQDASVIEIAFMENPKNLCTDGTYLYVGFYNYTKFNTISENNQSIAKIDLTDNSVDLEWVETEYIIEGYPSEMILLGNYIYLACNMSNLIIQIDITTATVVNNNYLTDFGGIGPQSLCTDGTFGYVTNANDTIYKFTLISDPISNICFPKDTPITTDQGIIKIQEIKNQTINGLKVEHVTQIIGSDNHLVCFEKDALYPGCPSENTLMTRNHKVCYNGEMVEAETLLNENIYLVPYNGEKLYNVLLEENGTMNVNNLLCETLDVNNVIARFYKSKYTSEEKIKITKILNDTYGTPNYKTIAGLFFGKY